MKTINWGIIGCGDVCEVKSGPSFYKCEHSALKAVMSRNLEKAADYAKRHNVPKWYNNANDLVNDPEVDAIYIATPPASHAEMTKLALGSGKPVYVEKPMGMNYQECLEMNRSAQENNQKLWVAYYRRSLPYFLKVKELIDNKMIGEAQVVKTAFFRVPSVADMDVNQQVWRVNKEIAGGGYFYDMAPHTIDIIMFILGNIKVANGVISNIGKLYNVEDTVSASFLFESGIVGSGIWCYVSSKLEEKDQIEILGNKGTVRFSTFDFSPVELITDSGIEKFDLPKPQHIQQPMIQSIIDELNGTGKCPSTGESGALTNWVIDKIFTK